MSLGPLVHIAAYHAETYVYETGNDHLVPHAFMDNEISAKNSVRKMTANLQHATFRQDTQAVPA